MDDDTLCPALQGKDLVLRHLVPAMTGPSDNTGLPIQQPVRPILLNDIGLFSTRIHPVIHGDRNLNVLAYSGRPDLDPFANGCCYRCSECSVPSTGVLKHHSPYDLRPGTEIVNECVHLDCFCS